MSLNGTVNKASSSLTATTPYAVGAALIELANYYAPNVPWTLIGVVAVGVIAMAGLTPEGLVRRVALRLGLIGDSRG